VAQSLRARAGPGASEEDDLFVSTAISSYAGGEDEHAMYRDMARRAVADAKVDSIHYVYRAQPIACGPCGDKKKKTNKKEEEEDDAFYYKDYYYGREVYDAYNVFAGRAAYMEEDGGSSSAANKPSSTVKEVSLRGARLRKKLHQQQVNSALPPLGPKRVGKVPPAIPVTTVDDRIPEFVPIKSRVPISQPPSAAATKATFVPFERKPAFVKLEQQQQQIDAPLPSFDEMLKRVTVKKK
jgi:hypothetical protein